MAQPTPPLSLKAAIRQIKQSYDFAIGRGRPSPFFFVIGAGISVPQVPLARDIIRECKKRSEATEAPPAGASILDEYSRWLDEAFPAPDMRQEYFQNLIEGKPIPAANFRLAHLLLGERGKKPLASLVVTTNFDNFLARALQLFGKEHVLCDSPSTAPRLVLSNADLLQIVHVHGTYYFYDIKNLSGEVEAAAALSEETTATMASLLDSVLRDRSPIVVGYGGWDGDVFMKSLKRRLRGGTLPQPLYWCCHRRNEWQSLPEWLRTHPSVRFVEPEDSPSPAARSPVPDPPAASSGEIPGMVASLLGEPGGAEPPVLDAQSVFGGLIQAFDAPQPELTQNPVAFFADQLERSLPRDGADLYRIKSTLGEMRAAAEWILEYRQQRTATEQLLQSVRERLRGAKYTDAMPLVMDIHLRDLNEEERDELWEMAWEIVHSQEFGEHLSAETLAMLDRFDQIAALVPASEENNRRVAAARARRVINLLILVRTEEGAKALLDHVELSRQSGDPEIRVSAAQLLFEFGRQSLSSNPEASITYFKLLLSTLGESEDERVRDLLAQGLLGMGLALQAAGRKAEAVDTWGTLLSRFGGGTSTLTPERIAQVAVVQGATLGELERPADELAVYDEIVGRLGDAVEPGVREQVAIALLYKALTLGKLGRPEDEVTTYEEIVRRYGEATEPGIREQVAKALFNKGATLGKATRSAEAVAAYDEIIRRCGEATEPGIREQVAKALFNKGNTLGKVTRSEEAMAAYEEVIRRYGEATEPGIREQVAKALFMKGVTLAEGTSSADAVATYDEIVRRFGEAAEPAIRELVAGALVNKGITLGQLTPPVDPVATYDEVVRRYGEAAEPGIREQVAKALLNKGVRLGELDRPEDEMTVYDEIVRRYGEAAEPGIREQVARALRYKGSTLDRLTRRAEKMAAYEELLRRFGEAAEPGIREQVGSALNGIAFDLLCEAKGIWKREGRERCLEKLTQARERVERALLYLPSHPVALGNLGYILFLAGDTEAGTAALREAIKLGGEEIRQGELADAEIDSLPVDDAFKELVRSIPAAG